MKKRRANSTGAKAKFRYKHSTPKWAEFDAMNLVYLKRDYLNRIWGTTFEVDHIIPPRSKTVCGLHCWANLQLLTKRENLRKCQRYTCDW